MPQVYLLFATDAIRQTLYDKILEEMGLLGAGQRSMNNKDPAYHSTPGLRRCAARRFQHTQLMSIEGHERSGKPSGRATNRRSPDSSCHEYQLSSMNRGFTLSSCLGPSHRR